MKICLQLIYVCMEISQENIILRKNLITFNNIIKLTICLENLIFFSIIIKNDNKKALYIIFYKLC